MDQACIRFKGSGDAVGEGPARSWSRLPLSCILARPQALPDKLRLEPDVVRPPCQARHEKMPNV